MVVKVGKVRIENDRMGWMDEQTLRKRLEKGQELLTAGELSEAATAHLAGFEWAVYMIDAARQVEQYYAEKRRQENVRRESTMGSSD